MWNRRSYRIYTTLIFHTTHLTSFLMRVRVEKLVDVLFRRIPKFCATLSTAETCEVSNTSPFGFHPTTYNRYVRIKYVQICEFFFPELLLQSASLYASRFCFKGCSFLECALPFTLTYGCNHCPVGIFITNRPFATKARF